MAVGALTAPPRPSPLVRGASFSRDRRYRYHLTRTWDPSAPPLVWVMLNPSAADSARDDPTTRRVMGLSRAWGFGACHVVNLFAYRTHRPAALASAADPVGPRNGHAVNAALRAAAATGVVVAGWGCPHVPALSVGEAGAAMRARIARAGLRTVTVGHNRDGSPRHPLYVPNTARLADHSPDEWLTDGSRHQP